MSTYLNPLRGARRLILLRTDQGVDYYARAFSPIYPIGRCRITHVSTSSGWPGGGVVQYVLLDGSHAGSEVYVAEWIRPRPFLRVGQVVEPTTWLAWFKVPRGQYKQGIETGWIRPGTNEPCDTDISGRATEGGIRFNRFLRSVGCPTRDDYGPGPDTCPC
jgi:hypothetical protein